MPNTINNYMTAEMEGDFVVFLTGKRLNRWWKLWKWIPLFAAMPKMTRELLRHPELGMLHYRYQPGFRTMMVVQYWRSKEALLAYATDKTRAHIPAWRWMNKAVGLNGDVGTWHETYMIKAGAYESLYVNMPEFGLGKAGRLTHARGQKRTARGRLGEKPAHNEWADLGITPARGVTAAANEATAPMPSGSMAGSEA